MKNTLKRSFLTFAMTALMAVTNMYSKDLHANLSYKKIDIENTDNNDGKDPKEKTSDAKEKNPTVKVVAQCVVCPCESDLPNGEENIKIIDSTTVSKFLTQHPKCYLQDGVDFQYGYGVKNAGDNSGELGGNRITFGPSIGGKTEVYIESKESKLRLRSVHQEGFLPFTGADLILFESYVYGELEYSEYITDQGSKGKISSEFYVHDDIRRFDNYEHINNPTAGKTYYALYFTTLFPIKDLKNYTGCGKHISKDNDKISQIKNGYREDGNFTKGTSIVFNDAGNKIQESRGIFKSDTLTDGTVILYDDAGEILGQDRYRGGKKNLNFYEDIQGVDFMKRYTGSGNYYTQPDELGNLKLKDGYRQDGSFKEGTISILDGESHISQKSVGSFENDSLQNGRMLFYDENGNETRVIIYASGKVDLNAQEDLGEDISNFTGMGKYICTVDSSIIGYEEGKRENGLLKEGQMVLLNKEGAKFIEIIGTFDSSSSIIDGDILFYDKDNKEIIYTYENGELMFTNNTSIPETEKDIIKKKNKRIKKILGRIRKETRKYLVWKTSPKSGKIHRKDKKRALKCNTFATTRSGSTFTSHQG